MHRSPRPRSNVEHLAQNREVVSNILEDGLLDPSKCVGDTFDRTNVELMVRKNNGVKGHQETAVVKLFSQLGFHLQSSCHLEMQHTVAMAVELQFPDHHPAWLGGGVGRLIQKTESSAGTDPKILVILPAPLLLWNLYD